jgi:hypothetical protein
MGWFTKKTPLERIQIDIAELYELIRAAESKISKDPEVSVNNDRSVMEKIREELALKKIIGLSPRVIKLVQTLETSPQLRDELTANQRNSLKKILVTCSAANMYADSRKKFSPALNASIKDVCGKL